MSSPQPAAQPPSTKSPEPAALLWVAPTKRNSPPLDAQLHSLRFVSTLIAAAIVWTLVIPGVTAYYEHVFSHEDIESTLKELAQKQNPQEQDKPSEAGTPTAGTQSNPADDTRLAPKTLKEWKRYSEDEKRREALADSVEKQIADKLEGAVHVVPSLEELLAARKVYAEPIPKPARVAGFSDSPVIYIAVATYICLILLILRGWRKGQPVGSLPWRAEALYVALSVDVWLRNFLFDAYERGRRFYSFSNADLGPVSFYLQELRTLGLSLLLVYLWDQRLSHLREEQQRQREQGAGEGTPLEIQTRALHLSRLFNAWQVDSLLLAGALLPWTYFYGLEIFQDHDTRYVLPAFLAHMLWGGTWLLLSMPLWKAQKEWSRFRLVVLTQAFARGDDKMNEQMARLLDESRPTSSLGFIGSNVVAACTFATPLFQFLFS